MILGWTTAVATFTLGMMIGAVAAMAAMAACGREARR